MRKAEQNRPHPPAYMAADELAFWLNCSERTIDAYSRVNFLPKPLKIGNLTRWRWVDIEEHIARQNGELLAKDGELVDGDEYSGDILKFKAAKRSAGKAGYDPTA